MNLRLICERHLEVQKYVYICFLDYEKAFDRVRHAPLMQCIREIVVDGNYIKIIRNLYWDQTASVRIMNELSEDIRIQRGVRQGCVATPTLFNLYTDNIFTHIINMKGVGEEQNHHVSSKVPTTCCKSLNLECMYLECRFFVSFTKTSLSLVDLGHLHPKWFLSGE